MRIWNSNWIGDGHSFDDHDETGLLMLDGTYGHMRSREGEFEPDGKVENHEGNRLMSFSSYSV